jgi:hypothetical protein
MVTSMGSRQGEKPLSSAACRTPHATASRGRPHMAVPAATCLRLLAENLRKPSTVRPPRGTCGSP